MAEAVSGPTQGAVGAERRVNSFSWVSRKKGVWAPVTAEMMYLSAELEGSR